MPGYAPVKTGSAKAVKRAHKAISLEKDGYEKFWVVSLSSGKTSKAIDTVADAFDWIIDNVDEKLVSGIYINRHWRKLAANPNRVAKVKAKKERKTLKRVVIKHGTGTQEA